MVKHKTCQSKNYLAPVFHNAFHWKSKHFFITNLVIGHVIKEKITAIKFLPCSNNVTKKALTITSFSQDSCVILQSETILFKSTNNNQVFTSPNQLRKDNCVLHEDKTCIFEAYYQ